MVQRYTFADNKPQKMRFIVRKCISYQKVLMNYSQRTSGKRNHILSLHQEIQFVFCKLSASCLEALAEK